MLFIFNSEHFTPRKVSEKMNIWSLTRCLEFALHRFPEGGGIGIEGSRSHSLGGTAVEGNQCSTFITRFVWKPRFTNKKCGGAGALLTRFREPNSLKSGTLV